jgi:hypothetical protein
MKKLQDPGLTVPGICGNPYGRMRNSRVLRGVRLREWPRPQTLFRKMHKNTRANTVDLPSRADASAYVTSLLVLSVRRKFKGLHRPS